MIKTFKLYKYIRYYKPNTYQIKVKKMNKKRINGTKNKKTLAKTQKT